MVELDISEYCVVLGIYISVLRLKYRFIEFGFFFFVIVWLPYLEFKL